MRRNVQALTITSTGLGWSGKRPTGDTRRGGLRVAVAGVFERAGEVGFAGCDRSVSGADAHGRR